MKNRKSRKKESFFVCRLYTLCREKKKKQHTKNSMNKHKTNKQNHKNLSMNNNYFQSFLKIKSFKNVRIYKENPNHMLDFSTRHSENRSNFTTAFLITSMMLKFRNSLQYYNLYQDMLCSLVL